jgi:hypothetical protein
MPHALPGYPAEMRADQTSTGPAASTRDTVGIVAEVLLPLVARGLIVRRPRVESILERIDADDRAIRRLQALRAQHGPTPLRIRILGREIAIVLSHVDAHRILTAPAEQVLVATHEKRAALRRFQPHGVLASPPAERPPRRRYNEQVLHNGEPLHPLAETIATKAGEEAAQMVTQARARGTLDWQTFAHYWWRLIRRVVLGDHAQHDQTLLDQLTKLRRDANWAWFAPHHERLRRAFQHRLDTHLHHHEPGSLAGCIGRTDAAQGTFPGEQVPQWLFAFDGAAMATFRTLALLDAHPDRRLRAFEDQPPGPAAALSLLRPALLESLRLWPTTPAILRETTSQTPWRDLPARTTILIYTPLFHRDPRNFPQADRYAPQLWPEHQPDPPWTFPFSAGHAACPGRELVTLLATSLLAHLLHATPLRQAHPHPIRPDQPITATLDPFRLHFHPAPHRTSGTQGPHQA